MDVGDKVVCIEGFGHAAHERGITVPVVGEIYTIRNWDQGHRVENKHVRYFRFMEFSNGPMFDSETGLTDEPSFSEKAFRKVDESFGEEVAEKLEVFFVPLEAAYKEQQHEN